MTTSVRAPAGARDRAPARRGRWIDDWQPELPSFWENGGARIARRNLIFSIFTEHIGFSVWSLWSVLVLFLGPQYHIDTAGKFLLTALPVAVGGVVRLPYTFAVARFGGRNWTVTSALLLLVPAVLVAVVLRPGVPYTELLLIAAVAGVGGGNFASSMANVATFYPQRLKGSALGLNAGGGNLGVAVVQLVALLVLAVAGKGHPRVVAGIYIPLIVAGAVCAALFMDNITAARHPERAIRDACRDRHTWLVSLLYIGTFGSFIGFSFAFGEVLLVQFKGEFPTPLKVASLTFLGPLLGSLARPAGGWLADRFGGALVTCWNFAAMTAGAAIVLVASVTGSFPVFLIGFTVLFCLSGLGNGSTYKMIPSIFTAKAGLAVAAGLDEDAAQRQARRLSGGVIGIAGAVGALGGVAVNIAFRQSFLAFHTGNAAYIAFMACYAVCMAITWLVYVRPSRSRLPGV